MTWEIPFVFALLGLALASFIWEKVPPDVTAMSLFAILLLTGILNSADAFAVFSNPAPITVGAMFILSAALERAGVIDWLAGSMEGLSKLRYRSFVLVVMVLVGVVSAFINNTPVVVVMMPIVLSLAAKMGIAGSKVLIPLSYAAIMGGTCTLLGTSTNILVNGMGRNAGVAPMGMFDFAFLGLPIFLAGTLYIVFFGHRILPNRETLTSILSEDERREYIAEAYVGRDSEVIGKGLKASGISKVRGIRVIDLIRHGASLQVRLNEVKLEEGDRLVLACRASGFAAARKLDGLNFATELKLGLEQIAAHEGLMVEGILGPNSQLLGKTIEEINFRQRFRLVVMAIHRKGRNLRDRLSTVRLAFGDTLLLLGSDSAIQALQGGEDIILLDRKAIRSKRETRKVLLVSASIAGVVICASFGLAPIEVAAVIACVFLFLTGCLRPKEGYGAIEWNILFIIFGMLALGKAMETTGASAWLADQIVSTVSALAPVSWQPYVILACVYLITTIMTEVLSNNAAAVLMVTLALGIAESIQVDPRPFLFAVAIGASASFATPIGYQTNTYVYGAGGYRFSDFVKVGAPLNFLCFIITMIVVPFVWPFKELSP